jgi:hypothetical protein
MVEPRTPTPLDDGWADQAADTVVKVVDAVREKTTGPVLTVARAIVYGLVGVFAVMVALVVLVIALIRLIDSYLPGEVWSAYLLLGSVFTIGGLIVWRQRHVVAHVEAG